MEIVIALIVLLFSAILHEVAHGYVADRLGDPTARLSGRLTLNPKSHIDPLMSIALPLLLIISGSPVIFGAAKPVPVDPFNLKEGRKDMAIVALSGPLTNVVLAITAGIMLRIIFFPFVSFLLPAFLLSLVSVILTLIVKLNLLLAIFNLLPIPPLDGSNIFALILPEKDANTYLSLGSIGIFILFFLLAFPIGGFNLSLFISRVLTFALSFVLP